MTSSDKQMDRELRALPLMTPARSVWSQVEGHMVRRQRRSRRQTLVRYSMPALAASLMVAVLVFHSHQQERESALLMQRTVENAVNNAMPKASFSNLQLVEGAQPLDRLLVSPQQRKAALDDGLRPVGAAEQGGDSLPDNGKIKEF